MTTQDSAGIHVDDYRFGRIVINGTAYSNDVKIVQGRIRPEWWRNRGHVVDPSDVEDILAAAPDVVILGRGDPGNMRASDELRAAFRDRGIELVELPTARAAEKFNDMFRQDAGVCAGFHLTC